MMPTRFWDGLAHVPIAAWQSSGLPHEVLTHRPFKDALLNQDDPALAMNPDRAKEYLRWRRASVQAVVYAPPGMAMPGRHSTPSLVALTKLLHRGQSPPLYAPVSAALEQSFGVVVRDYLAAYPAAANDDPILDLFRAWGAGRVPPAIASPIRVFDDDQPRGKGEERRFWARLQQASNGSMRRWTHPQVLFSTMRFPPSHKGVPDSRRVDYLLGWPMSEPRVWEIHGHQSQIDIKKSADMQSREWQVEDDILVPPDRRAPITNDRLGWVEPVVSDRARNEALFDWLDAAWCAAQTERIVALVLAKGLWSTSRPRLAIVVPGFALAAARAAADGVLETLRAVEAIWQPAEDRLRLLLANMTLECVADGIGTSPDLVVRIDPLQASYLAADEILPSNEIRVRRLAIPSDLALPEMPYSQGLLRHSPSNPPPVDALEAILKRAFGFDKFNQGQAESIIRGLAGENVLLLLPTGGGKSLVFQYLALLLPGAVVVIEGWKALMDDQWRNLRARGWDCGMAIHGDRPMDGTDEALLEASIIYMSPERLYVVNFETPFNALLQSRGVSLFVVDEAHAVSECGHSYRPSYIDLVNRLEGFTTKAGVPKPVVFAMTATAPDIVLRDICNALQSKTSPSRP